MTEQTVGKGKVVELKYTMKTTGGKVLDTSGDTPDSYIHGQGSIVPGLERALEGRSAGESFEVKLGPKDGFGSRGKSAGPQPVPRSTFPDGAQLKPGLKFEAETPTGDPVTLYITRIEETVVFVDTNHPFAGLTVHYDVEVVSVRDATDAEKRVAIANKRA
jgi:FKBP-type peptidyl-prolyl cis-trans isomerase SlyD